MDEALKDLAGYLEGVLPGGVSAELAYGELTLSVTSGGLMKVMRLLHDDPQCQFVCMIDVCGVDYPGREKRFDVVYHLLSPKQNQRISVPLCSRSSAMTRSGSMKARCANAKATPCFA